MNIYRSFKRFLTLVDLFQAPIIIKFQKREKTSTYFGVFFSMTIIIFLSIYFSKSDIFLKQSPNIVNIEVANVKRPRIDYSHKLFAISVTDDSSIAFNDLSVFTIKVTNRYLKVAPSAKGFDYIKNLTKTLHACTPSDFQNNWFYSLGLNGAFCLDENYFETVGFWDEDQVTLLEINIEMCDNKTSIVPCKSTTEIQSLLNGKVFNVYYEGVNVDPTNYTSPMNSITYNDYFHMDFTLRKKANFYLKTINIQTDDGWLVSDFQNTGNILYDSKDIDLMITTSDNLLFQCNFYSSRTSQNLQRQYQKLLSALSDLGGIANIVMIFGFFITSIENSFTLKKKVMNSLYSFQDIEKYKEKVESRKNSKNDVNLIELQEKSFKLEEVPTTLKFAKSESAIKFPKKEKKATFLEEKETINFENLDNATKDNFHRENFRSETFIAKPEETLTFKKQENPLEILKNKGILSKTHIAEENKENDASKRGCISPSKVGTFSHIPDEDRGNYYDGNSPNVDNEENGKSFLHTPREIPSFTKLNIKPVNSKRKMTKGKTTKIEKKIKNLEQYEEFLRKSSSRLNMNFCEYGVLYLKQLAKINLSEKEQLFLKGVKIYDEELDIVHILRKIQEIEKMKMVLFNEEQRILFNMIDKPMIYLDEKKENSSEELGSGHLKISRITNSATTMDENKMKRFFERMTSMQRNDEMTIIDRRLMDLVEKKLTEFMQNF